MVYIPHSYFEKKEREITILNEGYPHIQDLLSLRREVKKLNFSTCFTDSLNIIAETKRQSPSNRTLSSYYPKEIATLYLSFHAVKGISVLTDEIIFGGSYTDLKLVSTTQPSPQLLIAKGIYFHSVELAYAAAHGANAVLLIVRFLDDKKLEHMLMCAGELGLGVILEVASRVDITRIASFQSETVAIAINNRNLDSGNIDLNRTPELRPLLSDHTVVISASGIRHLGDIIRMSDYANAVLMGTHLMRRVSEGILETFLSNVDAYVLKSKT